MRPIIDAHLDLSWNALSWNRDLTEPLEQLRQRESAMQDHRARGRATVSLPEMRRGRIAVCLATLLARAKSDVRPSDGFRRRDLDYATQEIACSIASGQLAYYRLLEERREASIIRTRDDLDRHWGLWSDNESEKLPIGMIIAMEGADPIISPDNVEQWFSNGLRSVGLAHYGKGHYAVGTGDAGPLTTKGVELLKEFRRVGMILDLTHSSDPSFFQALDLFDGPVMASHNNCRALVPADRQFSDEQIRALISRDAVIGVVFDAWMLSPGWVIGQTDRQVVGIEAVADHIDYIFQLAGNARHAGFGSDLDGGFGTEQVPTGLESIADLQKFESILQQRAYSENDISAIFHGNWLRFFRKNLPT